MNWAELERCFLLFETTTYDNAGLGYPDAKGGRFSAAFSISILFCGLDTEGWVKSVGRSRMDIPRIKHHQSPTIRSGQHIEDLPHQAFPPLHTNPFNVSIAYRRSLESLLRIVYCPIHPSSAAQEEEGGGGVYYVMYIIIFSCIHCFFFFAAAVVDACFLLWGCLDCSVLAYAHFCFISGYRGWGLELFFGLGGAFFLRAWRGEMGEWERECSNGCG